MLTKIVDRRQAFSNISAAGASSLILAAPVSAADRGGGPEYGIDVTAFMTAEMLEDQRRGLVSVDCSPAFQAAIDAASARNKSTLLAGARLRIPGGRYLISKPLTFIWRDEEGVEDDGDMRRLAIEGDGSANVVLFYNGDPARPAFEVRGSKAGAGEGTSLRLQVTGLRLRRHPDVKGSGIGLRFNGVDGVTLTDVEVAMFGTNIDLIDTLRFSAHECWFLGAVVGIYAHGDKFSNPNVFSFDSCNLSGNSNMAALFVTATNIAFRCCCFEGNGVSRTSGACVLFKNGPSDGGAAAHFDTCYFENNLVASEVEFDWNTNEGGTVKLTACTFNRLANERASTHLSFKSLKAPLLAHIDSCAFKSYRSYRPSASNPAVVVSGEKVALTFTASYFQNESEAPPKVRSIR